MTSMREREREREERERERETEEREKRESIESMPRRFSLVFGFNEAFT